MHNALSVAPSYIFMKEEISLILKLQIFIFLFQQVNAHRTSFATNCCSTILNAPGVRHNLTKNFQFLTVYFVP